jgi:hypothetical protein
MRYDDCTAQASTRPFIVSVKRVNFPSTHFSCVFSTHTHSIPRMCSTNAYAPQFSLLVVSPRCMGPHQSSIRIKALGGSAVWHALPPPLATWLPQKTVGAMPRPTKAMPDRVAPMWVQPLGGSRHGRTRCRTFTCKVAGRMGQRLIRSGGCQPTPSRAHCPSPSGLIQRPWRSQRAPDRASHSSRPVPVYAPPP